MKKAVIFILIGITFTLIIFFIVNHRYSNKIDNVEFTQLRNFFAQTSFEEDKTNGEQLGCNLKIPILCFEISTIERDNLYKVKALHFFDKMGYSYKLSGTLSLNDFDVLNTINICDNMIDSLILNKCPKLEHINCHRNELKYASIKDCPNLEELCMFDNPIETLDLTTCPALKELRVMDCPLKELIVLESHPWRDWGLDSTTVIIIKKDTIL